jgi:hypothetical protein
MHGAMVQTATHVFILALAAQPPDSLSHLSLRARERTIRRATRPEE